MHASARAARWASLLVALVATVHRAALFVAYRADLEALVAANPAWWTMQLPPLDHLQHHLGATLLMLQQTPPISVLVVGVLAHLVPWPLGGAEALILVNAATSVATAVVLHRLLLRCFPAGVVLPTVVALAFVLSADLVVLEYNSFGQTLYENLGMLLVVGLALALVRVRSVPAVAHAARAGVVAGLLVLTRATWSFIALPGAVLVALLAPRARARATLAFLLPVVVLQGAWVLKNWVVYGRLSPATSSWTGYNLTNGLDTVGYGPVFKRFTAARAQPPWLETPEGQQAVPIPSEYGERDQAVASRFGVRQWRNNSAIMSATCDALQDNYLPFVLAHPEVVLEKTRRGYLRFWQPIANYGRMFVALFAPTTPAPSGLEPLATWSALSAGTLPQRIGIGTGAYDVARLRPSGLPVEATTTWTLWPLDPLRLLLTLLGVHVLAPLAALAWAWRRRTGPLPEPDATRAAALAVCLVLYAYLAVVANIGEFGENMRFRLGVEPLVWTLTLLGAAGLWRALRGPR